MALPWPFSGIDASPDQKRATLWFGALVMGLSALFGVGVGIFSLGTSPTNWHAGFESLRGGTFMLGLAIASFAGLVGRDLEDAARSGALKLKRWAMSPEATIVRFGEGSATQAAAAGEAILGPTGREVTLRPLLGALACVCLGVSAGLTVELWHRNVGDLLSPASEGTFWLCNVAIAIVLVLVGASRTAFKLFRWAEQEARREGEALRDAERANLTASQSRFDPDQLVAALARIGALAPSEPARAERAVEELSAELRQTLNRSEQVLKDTDEVAPADRALFAGYDDVAPAQRSLARLLWKEIRPSLFSIGLLAFVSVPLVIGWVRNPDRSLDWHILWLVYPFFLVTPGLEPRRMLRRGLRHAPSILGLTNPPTTLADRDEPGAAGVTLPIVSGLAAACFGTGIVSFASAASSRTGTDWWSVVLALLVDALMLGGILWQTSSSMRWLLRIGKDRASRAALAQADADKARLAALQAQTSPHFLFNALNTVAALIVTDGIKAQRTVTNLANVLRRTLARSNEPLAPLEEELSFVRDYLAIERERFGDRLQVTFAVPQSLGWIPVPTMSLQPLVENAIRHGLSQKIEGMSIDVSAEVVKHRLFVSVNDTGPGFGPQHKPGSGLGNLRRRLSTLFGEKATLTTKSTTGGASVTLAVPIPSTQP